MNPGACFRLGRIAAAALSLLAFGAPGAAQTAQADPTPPPEEGQSGTGPYTIHWLVGCNGPQWDLALDFRGVPIRSRDMRFFGPDIGHHPRAGPHIADADPTFMQRHIAKVGTDVIRAIPDPNFSGYGVIDWEDWHAQWERMNDTPDTGPPDALDRDFRQDWRQHITLHKPWLIQGLSADEREAVFQTTYDQAAKDIFTATLLECKRVRPNAKWGFYFYPDWNYWDCISTGAAREGILRRDDDLGWLWQISDAVFPCLYQVYQTMENPPPWVNGVTEHNDPVMSALAVRNLVLEAKRVAAGKPVLPFIWMQYMSPVDGSAAGFLNDINLRQVVEVPRDAGADGIVVWEFLNTHQEFEQFRDYFNRKLGPHLLAVSDGGSGANVNFNLDMIVRGPDGRPRIIRSSAPWPAALMVIR